HRQEIAKASPARMVEEYYKILRAGSSEKAFRALADVGLLEPTSPELQKGAGPALWQSLARLDAYRRRFEATPDTLTNAVLVGSLLVPLGRLEQVHPRGSETAPKRGTLPVARRDMERLRQILQLQRRLHDITASARAQRGLAHRSIFREALTWLDVHA